MHWIRVDAYYNGPHNNPKEVLSNSVPCMQCENAPCELVFPSKPPCTRAKA